MDFQTFINKYSIVKDFYNIIKKYYTEHSICKNNILYTTNKILNNYELQIIYKKIFVRKNNAFFFILNLNIQSYTIIDFFNPQNKEILDTQI